MDNMLIVIICSTILILVAIGFAINKIYKVIQLNLDNNNLVLNEIDKLSNKIDETFSENKKQLKSSIQKVIESSKKDNEVLDGKLIQVNKLIDDSNIKTKELIDSKLKNLNEDFIVNIDKVAQEIKVLTQNYEKDSIKHSDKIDTNFQNMVDLVKSLRLENLINTSNTISKYRNGIIEDEYFTQEVGFSKTMKIIDKKTNEITYVHYDEDGLKESTETYLDKKLKYSTFYDKSGLLSKGYEYDKESRIILEYKYDEAGEIDTKIEYEYDESGTKLEKQKIKY